MLTHAGWRGRRRISWSIVETLRYRASDLALHRGSDNRYRSYSRFSVVSYRRDARGSDVVSEDTALPGLGSSFLGTSDLCDSAGLFPFSIFAV